MKVKVGDTLFCFWGAMFPPVEGVVKSSSGTGLVTIEELDGEITQVNVGRIRPFDEFINPKPNVSPVGVYKK